MQTAFSVAKRVRTQTRIGANAVSVASAAVALARKVFENFVGSHGAAGRRGRDDCARRASPAREWSAPHDRRQSQPRTRPGTGAGVRRLRDRIEALATHLPEADIVISSTASPTPVITYDAVRAALRARRRKPMFMVDIAVPRDIEPEVAKLEDVYLFTIDDLQNVVNENLESRREAAHDANDMLALEIAQFEQQLKTLDAVPTIRQLRDEAEIVRAQTVEQARRMLAAGRDPREVDRLPGGDAHEPAAARTQPAAARGRGARRKRSAGSCARAVGPGQGRMKDSIRRKLERLAERHEEVSHLLADPGVIADTNKFRELSMEYSRLDPVVARYRAYLSLLSERTSAQEMAEGADNELRELGREELAQPERAARARRGRAREAAAAEGCARRQQHLPGSARGHGRR